MFLLHGLDANVYVWSRLASHLPGWRLVALDQRGHGGSERPAAGYSVRSVVADAVAAIRQLGLQRPVLVGHSWGGAIALELAAAHPELASALAFVDGPAADVSGAMPLEVAAAQMLDGARGYAGVRAACATQERYLGQAWGMDLIPFVERSLRQLPEGGVTSKLTLEARLEILGSMYGYRPAELFRRVEGPLLLSLASWTREREAEAFLSWKRAAAARVQEQRSDAWVRWYESHHEVTLFQPGRLAADLERLAFAAAYTDLAYQAQRLQLDWQTPLSGDQEIWTAKDLLAHLASTQTALSHILLTAGAEAGQPAAPFDADRWNASQVSRRRETTPDELMSELSAGAGTATQRLITADLDAPATAGPLPGQPIRATLQRLVRHGYDHLRQLESIAQA
ncbi:MAG: alpha/beta fold hydrolase [Candidatus Dormibacteraeota bacterium]|nr:alpha/beta fold hydrolase [Candidatus Dormibacteraeota bacterium]